MMRPSEVIIEISGICNARCPYCVKGSGAQKQGDFIALSLLDRILDHLKMHRLFPRSGCVNLCNWGEPMLHPQINEVLDTIGKYGLRAFISTNLIHLPELTKEALSVLKGITVSLSGFSQESYGYIHGKRITTVLQNIDRLHEMIRRSDCKLRPLINWHRYRFNEIELEKAKNYFKQRGIPFYPSVAYLADIKRTQDYFFNRTLPESERKRIEKDLFTDFLEKSYAENRDVHYRCPELTSLAIDENANLLLCCGWSNEVEGSVLGSIFNYDSKNMERVKKSSPLCTKCLEQGYAKWVHNQGNFSLSVRGIMAVKRILDRIGITHYLPEEGIKRIYSLVSDFVTQAESRSLRRR